MREGFGHDTIGKGLRRETMGRGTSLAEGLKGIEVYLFEVNVGGLILVFLLGRLRLVSGRLKLVLGKLERRLERLQGLLVGLLEFTIDGDIDKLVETGIRFHTGCGFGAAFEDVIIVHEEADPPLNGLEGGFVFESMGLSLGLFDEFAVCYASVRPSLGEMVDVGLQETRVFRAFANDETFFEVLSLFDGVHGAIEAVDAYNGHEIEHSAGSRSRIGRESDIIINIASQMVHYVIFLTRCHGL